MPQTTDQPTTTDESELQLRRATDRIQVRVREAHRPLTPAESLRQAAVVVAIAAAAAALTALVGEMTHHVRFAFFDCAVVISALYAGLSGGLFTMLVGILVVGYRWMPPNGSFSISDPAAMFAIVAFVIGGIIVTGLAARIRMQSTALAIARDVAIAADERDHLIAEAGRILSSSLDYEATIAALADLMVPSFADASTVDLLVNGKIERIAAAHRDPDKLDLLREFDPEARPTVIDDIGVATVIETGEPRFLPVITDTMRQRIAHDPRHLAQLRALATESAMVVPISTRGNVLGAITLVATTPDRRFSDADFTTAQAIARRAALAIDNARLYTAARSANEVKTTFISTMSHELRTPLNAIVGFQQLLADGVSGPVTEAQRKPLARIKASAMQLSSLIEEILLFSRLDAGTEVVKPETFAATRVVDDVVDHASAAAEECHLILRADAIDPRLEVTTDYKKLRQILITLVSNALKFTPEGEVVLHAATRDDGVVFEVRDTGVGIEASALEHIFDPFWQADQTKTRRVGGSGLGLSVARRLAHLLGGELSVESVPSKGSTFRVWVPAEAPPQSEN